MEFKDRLRELRGKRTQKEVADQLGVSKNTYNNWENGREPSYAVLKQIANLHHVTVDYLIGYSDRTHNTKELSETYGLSDKALHALDKMKSDNRKNSTSRCVIEFLNELLETEQLQSYANNDLIMRTPALKRTLSRPIQPTQMLTDLTIHIMQALEQVDDAESFLECINPSYSFDDVREAIIFKNANDIAQLIHSWLFYYCENPLQAYHTYMEIRNAEE